MEEAFRSFFSNAVSRERSAVLRRGRASLLPTRPVTRRTWRTCVRFIPDFSTEGVALSDARKAMSLWAASAVIKGAKGLYVQGRARRPRSGPSPIGRHPSAKLRPERVGSVTLRHSRDPETPFSSIRKPRLLLYVPCEAKHVWRLSCYPSHLCVSWRKKHPVKPP